MTGSIFKTKKANAILDTATIFVVLIAFAVISIIGYNTWKDVSPDIYASVSTPEANETLNIIETRYPSMLDGVFVFIFAGLWVISLVLSFMIDSHPIFFFVAIILLVFISISAIFAGNFFEELMSDSDLSDVSPSFPMTNWILNHLLIVVLLIGFSIIIVLYSKAQR